MERQASLKPMLVAWHDATSEDAWDEIANVLGYMPHLIHTLGWLIEERADYITLALNHDAASKSVSQFIVIPTGFIVSKQLLNIP